MPPDADLSPFPLIGWSVVAQIKKKKERRKGRKERREGKEKEERERREKKRNIVKIEN